MALRYYTPQRTQPISAFVPLPLDFYQQQLDRRENAYRQSLMTINSAEDIYGGKEVRLADVAGKNQLIEKQFGDVHNLVKNKYNGDYGKAYTDIVGKISKFQRDPRWSAYQTALEDEKINKPIMTQLAAKDRLLLKPGNNPLSTPVRFDEVTGQITMPNYTGSYMETPEYEKLLQGTISKLSRDSVEGNPTLKSGIEGMYKMIKTTGYSPEQLKGYVMAHPEIINAFKSNAGEALNWDPSFAGDNNKIANYITNQLMSNVSYGQDSQYFADPSFVHPSSKDKNSMPGSVGMRDISKIFGYKRFDDIKKGIYPKKDIINISEVDPMAPPVVITLGGITKESKSNAEKDAKVEIEPWIKKFGDNGIDIYNEAVKSMEQTHGNYIYPDNTSDRNELKGRFEQNRSNYTYRADGQTFANYNDFLKYVTGNKKLTSDDIKKANETITVQGFDRSTVMNPESMVGSILNKDNEYVNFTAETGTEQMDPLMASRVDIRNPKNFEKMESEWHDTGYNSSVKANYGYDSDTKQMFIDGWILKSKSGKTQSFPNQEALMNYLSEVTKK